MNFSIPSFNLSNPQPTPAPVNNTKPTPTPTPTPTPAPVNKTTNNTQPTPTPTPTPTPVNNTTNKTTNNTQPTPTPTPTPTPVNNTTNKTTNNTQPTPTPTPTPVPVNNTTNKTTNNTHPTPTPTPTPVANTTNNTTPVNNTSNVTGSNLTSFDSRTKWSSCIGAIRNQGSCGACWAFATIESFEDRLCIAGKVDPLVQRSPQYLMDCDSAESGCNGGYPNDAWAFLVKNGAPAETCLPYQGVQGSCPSTCSNGAALNTVKATAVSTYSTLNAVKNDIYTNGPIETYFMVYEDFYYYTSGIYTPTTTQEVGYHAVKVIGWGVTNGVNYWLVQNSWGTSWGINGFFMIEAGTCEFDTLDHFVSGTVN